MIQPSLSTERKDRAPAEEHVSLQQLMMNDYILEIKFTPSFHRQSSWNVSRLSGKTELTVEVYEGFDDSSIYASFNVLEKEAQDFYKICLKTLANYNNDWSPLGIDGIISEGGFTSRNFSLDFFSFWSPKRDHDAHKLVEAIFSLIETQEMSELFISYYEQLRWYFDFGVPVRIIEGNPKKLRISCGLSLSMESEISEIIECINNEEDLIVDMSNFDFMGTMLLPVFQPLVNRAGKTEWKASSRAMEYLKILKVPEDNIELNNID